MNQKIPWLFNQHCPNRLKVSGQGQVIVEYVLLLVIIVGLGTFIISQMASRNEESPGFLIGQWNAIIRQIGADDPNQH